MKSSYNPREEIEVLRTEMENLRKATDNAERLVDGFVARVAKLEKMVGELSRTVQMLNAENKSAKNIVVNNIWRNLGSTNRSIGDITRRRKDK
jgi:uncharacterized protein YoxC